MAKFPLTSVRVTMISQFPKIIISIDIFIQVLSSSNLNFLTVYRKIHANLSSKWGRVSKPLVVDWWFNALYFLCSLTWHSMITFTVIFPICPSLCSSPFPIYFLVNHLLLFLFIFLLPLLFPLFFSKFLASWYFLNLCSPTSEKEDRQDSEGRWTANILFCSWVLWS